MCHIKGIHHVQTAKAFSSLQMFIDYTGPLLYVYKLTTFLFMVRDKYAIKLLNFKRMRVTVISDLSI